MELGGCGVVQRPCNGQVGEVHLNLTVCVLFVRYILAVSSQLATRVGSSHLTLDYTKNTNYKVPQTDNEKKNYYSIYLCTIRCMRLVY
jgi:hypothetical protein